MMAALTRRSGQRWLAPEVVQTSAMDCGPAALKCLLEGFGVSASYGRLREACQTDVDGTSIDTIELVANQLGLEAEQILIPVDHLFLKQAQTLPAIVVVRHSDGATHFVVVWRRHGRWLQVMDPAMGRRWVSVDSFTADVFRHDMGVAAIDWRQWAATGDFCEPLLQRLLRAGVTSALAKELVAEAIADHLWFGLAALDACVRFVQSVVDAGGLRKGTESSRLISTLFRQTHASTDDIFKIIPELYWSVVPERTDEHGALQLRLRGAVLLRVPGLKALAAQGSDLHEDAMPARSRELIAALDEKPVHPLATIWTYLKMDGLLGPWALAGAMGIAAAVVMIEILLFRGMFDIAWALNLPVQRLGALTGLLVLVALLMLIEIPIVTESMRYGRHLEVRLRMALLQKLPQLSDRYLQSRPVSDMADRSHSIHMARQVPGFGLRFVQIVCDLCLTLVGIALLDAASLLPAMTVGLAALVVPLVIQPLLNERDLRVRNHAGALHVFNLDALLGLVPIRTHSAERAVRRQHEGLLVQWVRSARGLISMSLAAEAAQSLICLGLVGHLLWLHFTRTGSASGADLLLVYWALKLPALGQGMTALAHQYPAQRNTLLRLLEPLSAPTDKAMPEQASKPSKPAPQTGGVAISINDGQVLAAGHTILQDIQLHIAPGEQVAIVGASGAGKSTLLGLLLGWHRLSQGELQIDGAPLSTALQTTLRQETAWVDPAIQLWNQTFLHDLTCASEPNRVDHLGEVLDVAELRRVLQQLPQGLQTYLGEGGALLSGGEGQRVRLARALMQTEARLVLLDEPFRGLDRQQREKLLTQARQWWGGATLLCVTHDVAETMAFDRVLVVDGGRIIEDDSPSRLVNTASRYRELLEAEAQVRQQLWQGAQWRRLQIAQSGPLP
jgi:ABC-type bacteriocin/lantibiotic exporter with double-glycine peptidase domain